MLDFTNKELYTTPTVDDLELGEKALQYGKYVKLKAYKVRIFDTSKPDELKEYAELMPKLFVGVQVRNTVIFAKDRTLIDGKWKIYLEWAEYEVEDPDKKEDKNAEEG